jgi:hypothetical protein
MSSAGGRARKSIAQAGSSIAIVPAAAAPAAPAARRPAAASSWHMDRATARAASAPRGHAEAACGAWAAVT